MHKPELEIASEGGRALTSATSALTSTTELTEESIVPPRPITTGLIMVPHEFLQW